MCASKINNSADDKALFKRYEDDSMPSIYMNEARLEAKNIVLKNMRSSLYKMESINCPICNGEKFKLISQKDMYGLPVSVVICLNCNLIFNNPRLNSRSLSHFYENEYRQLDRGQLKPASDFFELEKNKGKVISEFLNENNISLNKGLIVEVGCGMGGILAYFKEKGFETIGCDLGGEYVDYGIKNYGLNLHKGGIETLIKTLGPDISKIKLIIYEQALEHISDLKKELAEIRKMASRDTLIYIGVPGLRNIQNHYKSNLMRYLQIPHLTHFELASLKNLLSLNGFEFVCGNEIIKSVFKINSKSGHKLIKTDVLDFLNNLEKERSKIVFKQKIMTLLTLPIRIYKKFI
jgi:2-polyprenyl-3-methyl-5-hydroxy-6-metoxy-1,4-benzoquinol methylase